METYSTTEVIKLLKEKGVVLFSLADFGRLFDIKNQNTLYKKIQRLEKKGMIKKLIKGKYQFLLEEIDDFGLANFLCQPSYISLESALSFYGIISAFSYKITSLTVKKSRTTMVNNKDFQYSHLSQNLFWGYEKKENFLIAEKEKALLDYLYFSSKGWRSIGSHDFETREINKDRLFTYTKRFKNKKLLSIVKKIVS